MTPFIGEGNVYPLSRITVAGLEDLGYTVDYSTAEAFGKADLGTPPRCTCSRRSLGYMFHGEMWQLGLESPTTQPRRLGDETRQIAIEYGLAYLAKQTLDPTIQSKLADNESATYVGDRVVTVLVRDVEGIFSVMVTRDD